MSSRNEVDAVSKRSGSDFEVSLFLMNNNSGCEDRAEQDSAGMHVYRLFAFHPLKIR